MSSTTTHKNHLQFERLNGTPTLGPMPLFMGVLTTLLGFLAIYLSAWTTLISVAVLGGLVIAIGIAQIVYTFHSRTWSDVLMHIFLATLYLIAGLVMLSNPISSAVSLTLFVAFLFMLSGITRIFSSVINHSSHWGWSVVSGFVSVFLGAIILAGWPTVSLWLIGCYLGIDFVFLGTNLIAIALITRSRRLTLNPA